MLPVWGRAVCLCVVMLFAGNSFGQPAAPEFDAELDPWTSGDGAAGDNFGKAIAQAGDWLAVGAPGDVLADATSITGSSQGTVYLYQRIAGNWEFAQRLQVPDAIPGAAFGLALALQGELLAAAAPRSRRSGVTDAGEVHLYQLDGAGLWQLSATAQSPLPATDGNFGQSLLMLSPTQIVIGAPGEAAGGQSAAGAAYLFTESGGQWQQQTRIVADVAESGARFGSALAALGSDLLVGVPGAGADDAGAVDLCALPSGANLQRVSSSLGPQGQFGTTLDADSNLVIVGAPNATVAAIDGAGAVAVYRNADLSMFPELLNSQVVESQARFGDSVRIDGNRIQIAAPQADVAPGFDEGIVEYYDVSAPVALFEGVLSNPFPGLSGRLGKTIVVDDSTGGLLLGADIDRVGPNNAQGSVSLFARQGLNYAAPLRLTRGDGAYLERFASAVAVDQEWAVVSSFLERTEAGAEAGSAYVYRRIDGQWQRYQRLLSPDPAVEQRFGVALSLQGEQLLIGAYWDATLGADSGAAYLYELVNDSWELSQTFRSPAPVESGHFGFAVALDPELDRLLIGEPGANDLGFLQGAGRVYIRNGGGWVLQASLLAPTPDVLAEYGTSVTIEGDSALLGGPSASTDNLDDAGAVAEFVFNGTWQFASRLVAPVPAEFARFGQSVALDGQRVAISAPQERSDLEQSVGAIYVRRSGAGFERLVASDGRAGDRLGTQLALCGERLVAGSPGVDIDQQSSRGALYVWADEDDSWRELPRFLTPDGGGLEGLGLSTDCDGEVGFAGAPFKAAINPQEGRAYSVVIGNLFADEFE